MDRCKVSKMDTTAVTVDYLLYVVMPLWLAAGVADWFCHRASRIAATSGAKESLIHLLMLAEAGIAVLFGLFLEINALVIATMMVCFLAHEVTAHWDLRYALGRRNVTPTEQHVHNYLGAIPFMALSFVIVLHWPQGLALFGAGPEPADFSMARKQTPLPIAYVVALLGAIALLDVLPYLEEFWRGLQANHGRLVPRKAVE
jgi:hypothetical protein